MKWQNKLLIGLSLAIASYFSAGLIVNHKANKLIEPYVKNHLEEIIENQERELNIKHFGKPKIIFNQNPANKNSLFGISCGSYDKEKDTIYIPLGRSITSEDNMTSSPH
jgi:hypothetical protein